MSEVAVAIHDVSPETLARCVDIRDRLSARGIDRVTLLAIPEPLGSRCTRSPEHVGWLRERRNAGDEIAQHGLRHVQVRRARGPRQWRATLQGGTAAEFVGLGRRDTARALGLGRAILREAGIEPRGFVAPAYAYTRDLRRELSLRFLWWAGLTSVRGPHGTVRAPALCLGASSAIKRISSPAIVRGFARTAGGLMRIDLHPADLEYRRTHRAADQLIDLAAERTAITYRELACSLPRDAMPAAA